MRARVAVVVFLLCSGCGRDEQPAAVESVVAAEVAEPQLLPPEATTIDVVVRDAFGNPVVSVLEVLPFRRGICVKELRDARTDTYGSIDVQHTLARPSVATLVCALPAAQHSDCLVIGIGGRSSSYVVLDPERLPATLELVVAGDPRCVTVNVDEEVPSNTKVTIDDYAGVTVACHDADDCKLFAGCGDSLPPGNYVARLTSRDGRVLSEKPFNVDANPVWVRLR